MDELADSDHLIGLMQRAVEGDDAALEDLLTRLVTPISRFLRRRFGGDSNAESWIDDLTQETLLRVIRFLGDCSATSNGQLMGWVLAIARRVAIDWLRSPGFGNAKETISMDETMFDGQASAAEWDPLADQCDRLLIEVLRSAVAASHEVLPEQTQQLVWLHVMHDATWPEIGQVLNTTPAGAKRRWQRAQKRLRREVVRHIHELPEGDRALVTVTLRRLGIEL